MDTERPDVEMTADAVRELLGEAIKEAGTAFAWASARGISPSYVSDVMNARREPGDLILKELGLYRVTTYRRLQAG